MFEEYKNAVLEFYLIKKKNLKLSYNLESPGREKLRKECVIVFLRKNSKADKDFIQSFFDPTNRYSDQVRSIEKFKLDKFRPLVSFLTEETNTRNEGNIKLLAWLIDFPTYEDWRQNPIMPEIEEAEPSAIAETSEDDSKEEPTDEATDKPTAPVILILNNEEAKGAEYENPKDPSGIETSPDILNPPGQEPEERPGKKNKGIIVNGIIVLVIGVSIFLYWQDKQDRETITKDEKCMFWTGDHYEAVTCNIGTATPKIDLNVQTLNRLKKITLADTLTKNSIGKVWYAKINKEIEFYTDSGMHPVDTVKRLKPITSYIISKNVSYHRYLLKNIIYVTCITVFIIFLIMAYKFFGKKRLKNTKALNISA